MVDVQPDESCRFKPVCRLRNRYLENIPHPHLSLTSITLHYQHDRFGTCHFEADISIFNANAALRARGRMYNVLSDKKKQR